MYAFTAIDHVGVAVLDLETALVWYRERFGMEAVHQEENSDQGLVEAMLQTSPDDDGAKLQLLAPLHADSPIAKFLERSGPGIHHIAFRVHDVDAVAANLREQGSEVLYETAGRGTSGSRINFVHPKDAGGVLIELVEPAVVG